MILTSSFLTVALGLSSTLIDPRFEPFLEEGCFDGPPIPGWGEEEGRSMRSFPQLSDMPMSRSSVRFIISPSSYGGDGLLMVQFDSGRDRRLAADGEPFLLLTVGKWGRTCSVRMPMDACSAAAGVLQSLKDLSIPVAFGMDTEDMFVMDGTDYSLQFHGYGVDGMNRLNYVTRGNPLEAPLEKAREDLRACWQPAFDAARAP